MCKQVIIIGASGHGKVIADIIVKSGDKVLGFLDDNIDLPKKIMEYPLIGTISDVYKYKEKACFIIGIGLNEIRKKIAEQFDDIEWYTAIHPSAQIALDVRVQEGTAIMANVVVNSSAQIGKHCIINSGAIVEHDNKIGHYVHISPNASLGGTVVVESLTHVGIGATIKNNICITSDCVIGSGAAVVKDIEYSGTYVGVPAKRRSNEKSFSSLK